MFMPNVRDSNETRMCAVTTICVFFLSASQTIRHMLLHHSQIWANMALETVMSLPPPRPPKSP